MAAATHQPTPPTGTAHVSRLHTLTSSVLASRVVTRTLVNSTNRVGRGPIALPPFSGPFLQVEIGNGGSTGLAKWGFKGPQTKDTHMSDGGGGGSSSSCRQFVTLAPGQAPRQLYGSSGTHTPWIHQCDFGVTNLTCQQPSPSRGELCTPTEGALPNLSQLPKVPENGVPLLCTPCFVGGGAVLGTREGGIWQTIT